MHDWAKDWYTMQYVVRKGWKWLLACFGPLLTPLVAWSAVLEVPPNNLVISGVSIISGWKCQVNGELTVRFNGGSPLPLVYGSERKDVLNAGVCNHDRVGFITIWNWGNLAPGTYEAVVYDAGVEFDRTTVTVVSPGVPFLRQVSGRGVVRLSNGQVADIEWVEALQSFVAVQYTDPPTSPHGQVSGAICTTRRELIVEDPDEDNGRWDVTNTCRPQHGYPNVLHIDITPLSTYGYFICIDEIEIRQSGRIWMPDYGAGGTAVWADRATGTSIDYTILPYRVTGTPYRTMLLLGADTGLDLTQPFTLYYDNELVARFQ